jgi:hypothetical protein
MHLTKAYFANKTANALAGLPLASQVRDGHTHYETGKIGKTMPLFLPPTIARLKGAVRWK